MLTCPHTYALTTADCAAALEMATFTRTRPRAWRRPGGEGNRNGRGAGGLQVQMTREPGPLAEHGHAVSPPTLRDTPWLDLAITSHLQERLGG